MSSRAVAGNLIFGAMLCWLMPASAATVDCSFPIGQLTAAQFENRRHFTLDPAKVVPLRLGDIEYAEYVAPKPTTQRAYDNLLHAGD